tara:strand:+ start:444 stop:749 length:306 start_codon:yes stop_codon:yes gene_type:complete
MDKQTAGTIIKQFGGNQFIAMTGAKNFVFCDVYMKFMLPKQAKDKINLIQVSITVMDTYDVEYFYMNNRTYDKTLVAKSENIYDDMLRGDFEAKTNLNTVL